MANYRKTAKLVWKQFTNPEWLEGRRAWIVENRGEPTWRKWIWIDYWLTTHIFPVWFVIRFAGFIAWDQFSNLLALLAIATVLGIPFLIGLLAGHFLWK